MRTLPIFENKHRLHSMNLCGLLVFKRLDHDGPKMALASSQLNALVPLSLSAEVSRTFTHIRTLRACKTTALYWGLPLR